MNTHNEKLLTPEETAEILADSPRIFAGNFPREFAKSVWTYYGNTACLPNSAFLYSVIRSRVRRVEGEGKVKVYKIIRGVKYWNEYVLHNQFEAEDITQRVFYRMSRMIGRNMRRYDGTITTKAFSYNWLNKEIYKADRKFYNQASGHHDDRIMRWDGKEWIQTPFYKLSKKDKRSMINSQTSNLPDTLTYLRVFPALSIEDTSPEPTIAESIRMPEDTTELEQLVIKLLSQGYSIRQIAPRIGRNKNQVEILVRKIRNDAKIRDNYAYNDTTYNARYSTVETPKIRTNRRGAPINAKHTLRRVACGTGRYGEVLYGEVVKGT